MAPLGRTITVALDMSKAFNTINIHTLIRKLLQTNIPGTIIKFITNYIKGRKAYTTYKNHTYIQRQFGVPQVSVISPTLFNINTADFTPPRAPVQVMANADDITITSTHTSTSAENKYIQPYKHKVFTSTKHNNLTLNSAKTTFTLFSPDPTEYTSNLNLKINNTVWLSDLDLSRYHQRGREVSTQFAVCNAVTAPPLVGCVFWSLLKYSSSSPDKFGLGPRYSI